MLSATAVILSRKVVIFSGKYNPLWMFLRWTRSLLVSARTRHAFEKVSLRTGAAFQVPPLANTAWVPLPHVHKRVTGPVATTQDRCSIEAQEHKKVAEPFATPPLSLHRGQLSSAVSVPNGNALNKRKQLGYFSGCKTQSRQGRGVVQRCPEDGLRQSQRLRRYR